MPIKIFISWSGAASGQLASALYQWIPQAIHAVRVWMSAEDLAIGVNWLEELQQKLQSAQLGILCLTPENLSSPWLLFEAGAIARTLEKKRVCPYLLGLSPEGLTFPLAQFQAATADQAGTFQLLKSINALLGKDKRTEGQLLESFEVWWPRLSVVLATINVTSHKSPRKPTDRELLEEMHRNLLHLRFGPQEAITQIGKPIPTWPMEGDSKVEIFEFFGTFLYPEALVAATRSYEGVAVRNELQVVRDTALTKMKQAAILHGLEKEFEEWAGKRTAG